MGRTIQDIIREQENEERKAKGKKADAAAASEINQGDLGAAARKAAGKKEEAPAATFSEAPPSPPAPDAGLAEQAKYQKAKREWQARKDAAGLKAGKQAESLK